MKFCESCNQHYYDGTDTCPVCGTVLKYYENEQINVEKQINFKRQSIKSCFTKKVYLVGQEEETENLIWWLW